MTLFLCAAGTSILGPPVRPGEYDSVVQRIEAKVARDRDAANGNRETFLVRVSAETNGLLRGGATRDDRVVFLVSDTAEGQEAAKRLVSLTENAFGCHARLEVISGLQMTDGTRFQREAIDALFRTLDTLTRDEPINQLRINATGGFKGTLPYLVLYAMVEGIEVSYVYEWSNALIRLPPLPVRFDWARLAAIAPALFAVCDAGPLNEAEWRALLPADYRARQVEYDALFLFEDGLVTLSGPGYLLKHKLEASHARTRILLSLAAQAGLEAADATIRRKFETILMRARNPLARRSGRHAERLTNVGSDLMVWKTVGPNAPRMLYWEDGDDIHVAELRLHDDYDAFWQRNPRNRRDYPVDSFVAWDDHSPPDYADLAAAVRETDATDPEMLATMRTELTRAQAEGQSARARLNQATKEARRQGLEQGRAEARNQARREAEAAVRQARGEAEAARRRAREAEERLTALEIGATPEVAILQRQILDLELYIATLENQINQDREPST